MSLRPCDGRCKDDVLGGRGPPTPCPFPFPLIRVGLGLGLSQPGCDLCDPWLLKHMRGSPLTEGLTTAVTDMRDREWSRHRPRCLCLAGTRPIPPLGGAREPPGSPNRSLVAPPAVRIASASRPGAPWAPWWVSVSQIVCLFLSLSRWCREVHCSPLLVRSDRPPGPAALPVIQPGGDVHHARCRTHMPTLPWPAPSLPQAGTVSTSY